MYYGYIYNFLQRINKQSSEICQSDKKFLMVKSVKKIIELKNERNIKFLDPQHHD